MYGKESYKKRIPPYSIESGRHNNHYSFIGIMFQQQQHFYTANT